MQLEKGHTNILDWIESLEDLPLDKIIIQAHKWSKWHEFNKEPNEEREITGQTE